MADVETLIVGGGISGICMAIQLLQAGRPSFTVVEKSGELGGTWSVNQYPGCACDVPSHLYSFSFDPNPSWSSLYADRQEIHEYLKTCAHRHGILPHFRFHTLALAAAWDEPASLWRVQVQDARSSEAATISAKFLVHAIGGLHVPKLPSIKGMERFAGRSLHSSNWDTGVNLEGHKVAIIGTGASAIQIVPAIAPSVKKLYVCQRTPPWIFPKPNFAITSLWKILFRKVPMLMWLFSCSLYLWHEFLWYFFASKLRILGEWLAIQHMKWSIKDAKMQASLIPKYNLGCKRTLRSSTFYPALTRHNVELLTEPIVEINEHNILLSARSEKSKGLKKTINVDVIIYATGFDPFSSCFQVTGSLEQTLHQAGASSLLGITKHGFPNFFMLLGPNTTLGHTSLILMVEAQVNYIIKCMKLVPPLHSMELSHSRELCYQKFLALRLSNSIWHVGGCNSWYFNSKNSQSDIIWPSSSLEYKYRSWNVNHLDYNFKYKYP